jgi:hypothetical protein
MESEIFYLYSNEDWNKVTCLKIATLSENAGLSMKTEI